MGATRNSARANANIEMIAETMSETDGVSGSTKKLLAGLVVGLLFVCGLATTAHALNTKPNRTLMMKPSGFDQWLQFQEKVAIKRLLANVSPSDAQLGVIVASPQRENPDYYYHWLRDAAVTAQTLIDLYERTSGNDKKFLRGQLIAFTRFSRSNQLAETLSGLGEPKFHVNGVPFADSWCRPQNDGPALRALALSRFAHHLLDEGHDKFVRDEFYDGQLPSNTVIKVDLEFVSHNWRTPNCDLWEEVWGDHFYTRMTQRAAMIQGGLLAKRLGDTAAADWYGQQSRLIDSELNKHWDAKRSVIVPTLNGSGTPNEKKDGLDASVILAFMHAETENPYLKYSDTRLLKTADRLIEWFDRDFTINQRSGVPGVAIGRYPGDIYAGDSMNGGNPWVLLTASFARFYFKVAQEKLASGQTARARTFVKLGDEFLKRLFYHAPDDGSMSEQIQRDSGHMTSARDLTWSYVEYLQAKWERDRVFSNRRGTKKH